MEEQIYLLFPLFLILIKNKIRLFYCIVITIVINVISRWYYCNFIIPERKYLSIFYDTFFRLDSFLAGVLVYFIYTDFVKFGKFKISIYCFGLSSLLILLTYFVVSGNAEKNNAFISGGGYTFIAFMYAGLLQVILFEKSKIISALTSFKLLRYTGKISYGMYIFHWPLFVTGFALLNKGFASLNLHANTNIIHLINVFVCIPVTYLLSHLSFKYYESYFLKRKAAQPNLLSN